MPSSVILMLFIVQFLPKQKGRTTKEVAPNTSELEDEISTLSCCRGLSHMVCEGVGKYGGIVCKSAQKCGSQSCTLEGFLALRGGRHAAQAK